jgi:hypothetical protein
MLLGGAVTRRRVRNQCWIYSWPRRIWQDVPLVIRRRSYLLATSTAGGIISSSVAPSHSSDITRIMYGLGGVVIGAVAARLLAVLWVLVTPYKYTLHWNVDEDYRGVQQGYSPAVWLQLISECNHRVNGLQCEIIRPGGESVVARPHIRKEYTDFNSGLVERDHVLQVGYLTDIPALPTGTYKVKWTSLTRNGTKRVTIAKSKIVVTPELLG